MDPQAFVRLSIGSLALRNPVIGSKLHGSVDASSFKFSCDIRLRGFPVQTASIPVMSIPQANADPHGSICIFNLEKSDVKALMAPSCFRSGQAYLEIIVFAGRQGSHCGISGRKQQIGVFRVEVGPEWGTGRSVVLQDGWISIGKNKHNEGKPGPELHLRVKLDPDPRYVFQFEDETTSSPQIVQIQGSVKQPIFSCKFSRDRRSSASDSLSNYWLKPNGTTDGDSERRERKGWKVMIHDLYGSAVAKASMLTPFVPATGSDRVSRSNPGSWLILRPDPGGIPDIWHPWGRLEAWRESGTKDYIFLRFYLIPDDNDSIVSDVLLSAEKGGEFFIDMDRQTPFGTSASNPKCDGTFEGHMIGGFVMNCKVQGEGKSSKPLVQLAMQHVTCVEDAALFIALAAAVDLSIEACRPFRRRAKRSSHNSL